MTNIAFAPNCHHTRHLDTALLIVDAGELTVAGIRDWLAPVGSGAHVCAAFADPASFLDAELASSVGRIVVVDPQRDGTCDISALRRISARGHRVVVFSAGHRTDPALPDLCLEQGAATYLCKSATRQEFLAAIAAVRRGTPHVSKVMRQLAAVRADVAPLSRREREVIRNWVLSPTKEATAKSMYLSIGTVNTHVMRARQKYADAGRPAPTKADLTLRALEDGIVTHLELGHRKFWHDVAS